MYKDGAGWCVGTPLSAAARCQWKLLIMTTSVLRCPRENANCLPSRDQEKPNMSPPENFVTWKGSPPASGCSQILVARLRVSIKARALPSGVNFVACNPKGGSKV